MPEVMSPSGGRMVIRIKGEIKTAIRLKNGMVMVFDSKGEQIPEYQGWYEVVRGSILRDAPPSAMFCHWFDCEAAPEIVYQEVW
ncbi:MAG TPA: hypothetical protein G4O01_02085 [Dehalococcoidia bacterium]|nr:hypothetical protein [Dehalococcoidia bacterium]